MNTATLTQNIAPLREELLNHPLYEKIRTVEDLRHFLEGHVYAVWDFMSLLKALQQKLTCTTTPWFALENPDTRYLINEIVVAEESDLALDGRRLSHYEMYIEAMTACGADTTEVTSFLEEVKSLRNIYVAIRKLPAHSGIKAFLEFTFKVIDEGKAHEIAAAFTFGREDLIPSMFTEILRNFQAHFPETDLRPLVYYFERHIELDGDDHGPKALNMVTELCGDSEKKWKEAEAVSIKALEFRIGLWDAIYSKIAMPEEVV